MRMANLCKVRRGTECGSYCVLHIYWELVDMCLFYTMTGTFAYLIQGSVIDALESDFGGDIEKFAYIDLITNTASVLLQILVVRRAVTFLGIGWTLAILPALTGLSFGMLWLLPTYTIVVIAQVLRRATNYGLTRPAREMLYTPLPTEEKYMAKNLDRRRYLPLQATLGVHSFSTACLKQALDFPAWRHLRFL